MNDKMYNELSSAKSLIIIGLGILGGKDELKSINKALFDRIGVSLADCTVVAESDNQLFQYSLMTDNVKSNRISFEQFKIRRDFFKNALFSDIVDETEITYKVTSLSIPAQLIKADDSIWYATTTDFESEGYVKLDKRTKRYAQFNDYIEYLLSPIKGGKYSAEFGDEMLELFDQKHVPRGIFPRDSFYGTDHFQYVVWGLVFNRDGKILIHKRKSNAKDNQNMWDKSIGGHIDFNIERSTPDAASRELIEELFTKENKQQQGHSFSMLSEDLSKIYYLGDWRIEDHGVDYLSQIKLLEKWKSQGEENWVFYKIPTSISHNTPRILPDGRGERWLRVIADVFVFISNTSVTDKTVKGMENSKYLLVEPSRLKTWIDKGEKDILAYDGDDSSFKVTPDLKFIMTGALRDIIEEVSMTIQYSDLRKP